MELFALFRPISTHPARCLLLRTALCALLFALPPACGGEIVRVTTLQGEKISGLKAKDIDKIQEIKKAKGDKDGDGKLSSVLKEIPHYTVSEYFAKYPEAKGAIADYTVGGNDVLNITVYEEPDLSRERVSISAKGNITVPLIDRLKIDGLTTSEIEELISNRLAQQQYLLDAHVSVSVVEYKSKNFLVFGAINGSGTYSIKGRERLLDALSKVGGMDPTKSSSKAMLIRTLNPDSANEQRVVIEINLAKLLKKGDQRSNIHLFDKDVLYIPPVAHFYIIGQVAGPGAYDMPEGEITLVEAIGMAGGFTPIASRNSTRIIRVEDGVEKIIEVRVDAIIDAGKKIHDVIIKPDDIIVVPESFF